MMDAKTLTAISKQYGDTFYLLDAARFRANCLQLMAAFQKEYPHFQLAYSFKTNYTPRLVRIVADLGGYAEVVSDMEAELALRCGFAPRRILWNGPVKQPQMMERLLLLGGIVNIDSADEAEGIRAIADAHPDRILHVGIRCNYDVGDGVLSRFGVDVDSPDFDRVLQTIRSCSNIELVSLQAHFAKRDPQFWTARATGMLAVYDRVTARGFAPRLIDLGGGIYGQMPQSLRDELSVGNVTYDDYAQRAARQLANHFASCAEPPALMIEPGTAVAADCMTFVTRIASIKTIRSRHIATTAGSQKNISMTGIHPPIEIVPCGSHRRAYDQLDIAGFTCIENDYLYKDYRGDAGVGDFVLLGNCGSYSIVMKPPFILPNVPVLEQTADGVRVIKRQETFDDIFHTFAFDTTETRDDA